MITLFRILEIYNISTKNIRLVRHGNKEFKEFKGFSKEPTVLETFRSNLKGFEAYQSFQSKRKFGDAKHIAVFSPLLGNASLFLGLWKIDGCVENSDLSDKQLALIDQFEFPQVWKEHSVFYKLILDKSLQELSQRLVIGWGGATVSWVQRQDKPILELKRPHSIDEFLSYSEVRLSYYDLKQLMKNEDSNLTWQRALSSVNGIYLIRDTSSGKLYVGSAYGEQGIYGRWKDYALTGNGSNKLLIDLDHTKFDFSILEITPLTYSAPQVIQIENKWKERLGTRLFGNLNCSEGLVVSS